MKVNGGAIDATRPIAPYKEGQVVFTRKGDTVYAFCLIAQEGEPWPERVGFSGLKPAPHSKVYLLGTRKALSWQTDAEGRTTVEIPARVRKSPPCQHAFALQFTAAGF
jgi:alpha-L-fucosidase